MARRILGEDVTRIEVYPSASSAWWARFTFNGITRCECGTYAMVGGEAEAFCAAVELSDAEREELLQLCRMRLNAFRAQHGEGVVCLLIEKPAASATAAATACRSAARSKSGFTDAPAAAASAAARAVARQIPHQRALEVDPIVPSNHGGTGDLSNLQALCFRCNAGSAALRETGCVFCSLEGSGLGLLENEPPSVSKEVRSV